MNSYKFTDPRLTIGNGPGPGQTTDRMNVDRRTARLGKRKDETFCRLDTRAIRKTPQAVSSGRSRGVMSPACVRRSLPDWCDRAEDGRL